MIYRTTSNPRVFSSDWMRLASTFSQNEMIVFVGTQVNLSVSPLCVWAGFAVLSANCLGDFDTTTVPCLNWGGARQKWIALSLEQPYPPIYRYLIMQSMDVCLQLPLIKWWSCDIYIYTIWVFSPNPLLTDGHRRKQRDSFTVTVYVAIGNSLEDAAEQRQSAMVQNETIQPS